MRIFLFLIFCFILSSNVMAIQIVKEINDTGEIITEKPLEKPVLDLNNKSSELPPGLENCHVIYGGGENLPEEMKALGISENSNKTEKISSAGELPADMEQILESKTKVSDTIKGKDNTGRDNIDRNTVSMVNKSPETVTHGNNKTLLWYVIITAFFMAIVIYKAIKPFSHQP